MLVIVLGTGGVGSGGSSSERGGGHRRSLVFERFLERYHKAPSIARARTVMPDTIPPTILARFVLDELKRG